MTQSDNKDVSFKQLYVYCGVCNSDEGSFYLTSCAHLLCTHHHQKCVSGESLSNGFNAEKYPHSKGLDNVGAQTTVSKNESGARNPPKTLACPVCKATDISVVPLTKESLPMELQSYFRPYISSLESIYAIAKFQTDGLVVRCQRQIKTIAKLAAKYKEVLRRLREEMNNSNEFKTKLNEEIAKNKQNVERIVILEQELETLRGRLAAVNTTGSSATTLRSHLRDSIPLETSTPLSSKQSSATHMPPPQLAHSSKRSRVEGSIQAPHDFVSSVQRSAMTNPVQRVSETPRAQGSYKYTPDPENALMGAPRNIGGQPSQQPQRMYYPYRRTPTDSELLVGNKLQSPGNYGSASSGQMFRNGHPRVGDRHGVSATVLEEKRGYNGVRYGGHPNVTTRRGMTETDGVRNGEEFYGEIEAQQYYGNGNRGGRVGIEVNRGTSHLTDVSVFQQIESGARPVNNEGNGGLSKRRGYPTFDTNPRAAAAAVVHAHKMARAESASPFKRMYSRGSSSAVAYQGDGGYGNTSSSRLSIPSTPKRR